MFIETLSYSAIPFGVCLRMQAQKPDQSPECLGHACPLLLCSRPVMAGCLATVLLMPCQLEGALNRHYDASNHHVVWRLSEPSLANHGHVVARGRKHDLHRVVRVAARPARAGTERASVLRCGNLGF